MHLREWVVLGPFDRGAEPCPKDLFQWYSEGLDGAAISERVGAPWYTVTATGRGGIVHFRDRFDLPRDQVFYFLANVHVSRNTAETLWFSADTAGQPWCGVDATKGQLKEAGDDWWYQRDFPLRRNQGREVELEAGTTPVLVRLRNYFGEMGFVVAVQDAEGGFPDGVVLGD